MGFNTFYFLLSALYSLLSTLSTIWQILPTWPQKSGSTSKPSLLALVRNSHAETLLTYVSNDECVAKATVKQTPNFWTQGPLWDPKKGALRRANSTRARAEAGLYFRKNFQQLTLPLRLLALDHALHSTYPVRACGFRRTDQAYYSILQYVVIYNVWLFYTDNTW